MMAGRIPRPPSSPITTQAESRTTTVSRRAEGGREGRPQATNASPIRTRKRSSTPTRDTTASTDRSTAIAVLPHRIIRRATRKAISAMCRTYGYNGGATAYGRAVPRQDNGGAYPNTYPNGYPNTYPYTRGPVYPSYPGSNATIRRLQRQPFQNGVNDGYEKGLEDARKNRIARSAPPRLVSLRRSSLREPVRTAGTVQGSLSSGIPRRIRARVQRGAISINSRFAIRGSTTKV